MAKKLPKEMSPKKESLEMDEMDPIFGEDMDLADDVSEPSDLDSALDAERLEPAAEGDMTPEDEMLIEDFKELVKRNPSALDLVKGEGGDEESDLDSDLEEDLASAPEKITGSY